MILKLFDKLIFAAALILSLQLPLLADHYHQYLSGLYKATQWQVDGYESTAKKHEFADVKTMINQHLKNTEPSVRTDAQQKLATLDLLAELKKGMSVFEQGNLLQKLAFMFHPDRYQALNDAVQNFKPGIPLSATGLLFGLVFGLLLNLLLMLPFWLLSGRKRA